MVAMKYKRKEKESQDGSHGIEKKKMDLDRERCPQEYANE